MGTQNQISKEVGHLYYPLRRWILQIKKWSILISTPKKDHYCSTIDRLDHLQGWPINHH